MRMNEPLDIELRGRWGSNLPMAQQVSWRAGGRAARSYVPADLDDLCACLAALPKDEPRLFAGLGSNLLVRDGGFPGTVFLLHGALRELRLEEPLIYAEAGVASPKLARFVARNGCVGAEFLAGIPGTIGGALAMNAGCYGGETWPFVERVLIANHAGEQRVLTASDFEIGYRHVRRRDGDEEFVFLAAWFRFPEGDGEDSRQRISELLAKRQASQPLELPNAGSVFRNPSGDHAARLIEAAGLKGLRIGGAQVSTKHANFIVNPEGHASAADIESLIEKIQAEVAARFGIQLQREVRIVGEKAR